MSSYEKAYLRMFNAVTDSLVLFKGIRSFEISKNELPIISSNEKDLLDRITWAQEILITAQAECEEIFMDEATDIPLMSECDD